MKDANTNEATIDFVNMIYNNLDGLKATLCEGLSRNSAVAQQITMTIEGLKQLIKNWKGENQIAMLWINTLEVDNNHEIANVSYMPFTYQRLVEELSFASEDSWVDLDCEGKNRGFKTIIKTDKGKLISTYFIVISDEYPLTLDDWEDLKLC